MSEQLTLDLGNSQEPGRWIQRLFLGLFPDAAASAEIENLGKHYCREMGLEPRLIQRERFHTTVAHVSDRLRLRSKDEYVASVAAKAIRFPAFELTFSYLESFAGMPKKGRSLTHPLVLLAEQGPVTELYRRLRIELEKLGRKMPEIFVPHLTLKYDRQFVERRAIKPVSFLVRSIKLIHSRVRKTEYRVRGDWALDE